MKDKEELEVSFGQNKKTLKLSPRKDTETWITQLEDIVQAQIEMIQTL